MCHAIYAIVNTVNEKRYVGSAVNLRVRWYNHKDSLRHNRHHSIKLQRAWNKYGADKFSFVILEEIEDPRLLIKREQFWIDRYNAATKGYNCRPTAGSSLGYKDSDETKRKKSAALKGKPKSPDHVAKVSAALKGKPGTRKGAITPQETRAKQSAAAMGRKMPEASRARFNARTHDERSTAAKKAWVTRRTKAAATAN